MLLDVGQAPTFADAQAAITWSSGVTTSIKTDFKLKNLIGRGSGETLQMAFSGQGWVLVQPSEGRVVLAAEQRREQPAQRLTCAPRPTLHLVKCQGMDETCPVCRTADIVCGKWTLLLVRDLAEGRTRFCELERSLQGISPRTLSLRLRALEEEGIVERQTFAEVPPRVEYALTEKGLALLPIIDGMREYGTPLARARDACDPSPPRGAEPPRGGAGAPPVASDPVPPQPRPPGRVPGGMRGTRSCRR